MKGCSHEQVIYTPLPGCSYILRRGENTWYPHQRKKNSTGRSLGKETHTTNPEFKKWWLLFRENISEEMPLGKLVIYELEVLRAGQGYLE